MFDVSSQDGHGKPIVDELTTGIDREYGIDKACQILSHGYHCSLLDAEQEGDVDCVQKVTKKIQVIRFFEKFHDFCSLFCTLGRYL